MEANRVIRFQRAYRMLGTLEDSLADIAYRCGYSDQAHFTREVREFAGVPPTRLPAETADRTGPRPDAVIAG